MQNNNAAKKKQKTSEGVERDDKNMHSIYVKKRNSDAFSLTITADADRGHRAHRVEDLEEFALGDIGGEVTHIQGRRSKGGVGVWSGGGGGRVGGDGSVGSSNHGLMCDRSSCGNERRKM